jgi:hypothetical protein
MKKQLAMYLYTEYQTEMGKVFAENLIYVTLFQLPSEHAEGLLSIWGIYRGPRYHMLELKVTYRLAL